MLQFWVELLGPHYKAFFDEATKKPIRHAFSKIQHLEVWNAILKKWPDMIVVWAHMGMSKELVDLHPVIHGHILTHFFEKYPNLYSDVSWDVLPKQVFLNYDDKVDPERFSAANHADLHMDAKDVFNLTAVVELRKEVKKKTSMLKLI